MGPLTISFIGFGAILVLAFLRFPLALSSGILGLEIVSLTTKKNNKNIKKENLVKEKFDFTREVLKNSFQKLAYKFV